MTDNEILLKILEKVEALESGQKALESGQKSLESGQKSLESGQKSLESGQKSLESGQKALESGQESLKTEISKIWTRVNHTLPQQINLIAEQHGEIIAKLDAMADYPDTKGRVATLEHVVQGHTKDISELKKQAI